VHRHSECGDDSIRVFMNDYAWHGLITFEN
jgi:hypothetical protein